MCLYCGSHYRTRTKYYCYYLLFTNMTTTTTKIQNVQHAWYNLGTLIKNENYFINFSFSRKNKNKNSTKNNTRRDTRRRTTLQLLRAGI